MASVHRQVGTKYWIAAFRLPNGKRTMRSTKETDKSKALQIALKLEGASRQKATADQAQKVLADIVRVASGDTFSVHRAHDWIDRWLATKRKEVAASTFEKYWKVLGQLKVAVPEHFAMADISQVLLSTFRDEIASKTTVDTANSSMKVVRTLFKDAHDVNVVSENIALKVRFLREAQGAGNQRVKRRAFKDEEMRLLLKKSAEVPEWDGMVLFGLYTGQRLGDIARAKADQIAGGVWRFRSGKTGRQMDIPLAGPVLEWLKAEKRDGFLFPESAKATRTGTLSNRFYDIMVGAGIASKRSRKYGLGKGRDAARSKNEISFHSLRHTLTTWLKAAGVSESIAMEFVGHESAAVNRTYTHLPLSVLIEAAGKLPDITRSQRSF